MDGISTITDPGFATIRAELRGQDPAGFDGAFCRGIHRRLRALRQAPDLRIALLGNVTLDLLAPFVATHAARDGWHAATQVGPIGQEMQALGSLGDVAPDMVLLALSLRLLRPQAMAEFAALSDDARRALRDEVLDHVEAWATLAAKQTSAALVIANFPAPPQPALGIADSKAAYGEAEFHLELNLELLRRLRRHPRVQLLDLDRIAASVGHARAFDARLFHLAKTDWSPALMAAVGEALARHAVAARGAARKCLVLDLDNTLWGGVIGEEGPEGVLVGPGDATGEAFMAFQQRIRTLKQRGILLAMCSKNNPGDVDEVFALRPEMPLRRDDFSAAAIGWNAKHEGLRAIAAELNIGTDSLVFIDDNPAEVTLIREMLPEVETVLLPEDPSRFVATLDALHAFEKPVVLADDIGKAEQYVQAAARTRLSATAASFEDYLAGLETRVTLRRARPADLPRVAQLCAKTNQFNVSGRRHGLGELEAMLDSPTQEILCISVADRFGDLGLVGVSMLREDDAALHVDTLLMSCRALGRGVETALMNRIKAGLLARPHLRELAARFVPTAKNHPAASYFAEQGLVADLPATTGPTIWRLARDAAQPVPCDWLTILGDQP